MDSHNRKKTPLRTVFGSNIRLRRLSLNLSQAQLAKATGLHVNYIGSIERGERNLGLENIFTLAQALNCKPSELMPDGDFSADINTFSIKDEPDARLDNLQFQLDILMDLVKELKNNATDTI